MTLESELFANYLVENNGVIEKVGYDEVPVSSSDVEYIDLQGKTLMPSFIDSHSHFSAVATSFLQVSLDGVKNFDQIKERIRDYILDNKIKPGEWVLAKGYDHNLLEENRHITLNELDEVSLDNPLVIQHKSGHVGVFNSYGLKELGIDENTKSSGRGLIQKVDGKLTGYMEENDFVSNLKKIPMNMQNFLECSKKAQDMYLSNGITTVQEGLLVKEIMPFYKMLLSNDVIDLDLIGYPDFNSKDEFFDTFPESVKKYNKNFKLLGVKLMLDGSPQGKTAWLRSPYEGEEEYSGYPLMTDEEVYRFVKMASDEKIQIIVHCNGDMAANQYIKAVKKVGDAGIRPVMIHAQLLGVDQLDELKECNIIPSFFIAHIYHWGDVHIKNLGIDRASRISPAKSTLDKDIIFTFHQDSPVIMPNMLETIWCAVNRKTKDGVELGANERITPLEAIKAVTINAAYQYFEEDYKGSLKEGKQANFVILSSNPLDDKDIRNIKVLETIKLGKTLYSNCL